MNRPVWVTGLGCTCGLGKTVPEVWGNMLKGRTAVAPVTRFSPGDLRSAMVAEAPDPEGKEPHRVDRLALRAARETLESAGLEALPEGSGMALGASVGGLPESEEAYGAHLEDGRWAGRLRPFAGHAPANTTDVLAKAFGADGPRTTVTTACSSSAVAIGLGGLWISSGTEECVLAGGADALSRLTVGGFNILRLVSPDPPAPFDENRSGMAVGEGAAFLLLESPESAVAEGRHPLAFFEGMGLSSDAFHATAPEPDGQGALEAMRMALASSGLSPEAVDHVNAHGTGTRANDLSEARAIRTLLGPRAATVPVASIKGAVGHCLGAAGAIEAVVSVLSLLHQRVPPTVGLQKVDPEVGLSCSPVAQRASLRTVLSLNMAFGGNNAALLFGRAP